MWLFCFCPCLLGLSSFALLFVLLFLFLPLLFVAYRSVLVSLSCFACFVLFAARSAFLFFLFSFFKVFVLILGLGWSVSGSRFCRCCCCCCYLLFARFSFFFLSYASCVSSLFLPLLLLQLPSSDCCLFLFSLSCTSSFFSASFFPLLQPPCSNSCLWFLFLLRLSCFCAPSFRVVCALSPRSQSLASVCCWCYLSVVFSLFFTTSVERRAGQPAQKTTLPIATHPAQKPLLPSQKTFFRVFTCLPARKTTSPARKDIFIAPKSFFTVPKNNSLPAHKKTLPARKIIYKP